MRTPLTGVDLFCGAGGLTFGFRLAGFNVMLGVDFDHDAILTYRMNNPGVETICKDIRKMSVTELMDVAAIQKGDVDVLMAGIPCEGYSILNRRYDPTDPRNYLFLEFVRVARGIKPKAVVIENVPGLFRRKNGSFKAAVEKALGHIGYHVTSFELDAAMFGVPQKRTRVFFVGFLEDKPFSPPRPSHLNDAAGLEYFMGKGHKLKRILTVWDAISDLPPLRPGEKKDRYGTEPLTEYQRLMREGSEKLHNHEAPKHPEWTVRRIRVVKPGAPIYKSFKQRIRLSWHEPSPTIPAGGVRPQWFFAHPEQPRGLTVREMARLQSFPDKYVFLGSMIKQRILVGDAVPPLLARAIASQLREAIE